MGRCREITITSRALEYKKEGFYVHDRTIIMCKFCNSRVEWKRRDSCEKHILSKTHIGLKTKGELSTSTLGLQSSIAGSFETQVNARKQKVDFIMDTTAMFLKVR